MSIIIINGSALESLDYKLYKWPGFNLPDKYVYQCIEEEYMTVEDYQHFIEDPTDFWLRVYLPRVYGAFESFRMLSPFTNLTEQPMTNIGPFAQPEVQASFQAFIDVGREIARMNEDIMPDNADGTITLITTSNLRAPKA